MSHQQLPIKCAGHSNAVFQLAYSQVCESGYYLASACQSGEPMLRHGDTGDWVGTFKGHDGPVFGVDLNANATLLATSGDDCTVRIWNALDGVEIKILDKMRVARCVAFDSKAEYLVAGSQNCRLVLYSLQQSSTVAPTFYPGGHSHGVRNVLFCRDDRALLSSSHDRTIRLWDRLSHQQVHHLALPHHAKSLELCADRETVTIAYSKKVLFINANTFEVLLLHHMVFHLKGASLHPQKESFVCAGSDHFVYKCDYKSGSILESFEAHCVNIRSIKYSPDGEVYATSANDGSIHLWQQNVGKNYGLWRSVETRNEQLNDNV
ncbi:serine-threonine kinase receptor-associated protein [Scaptodrosophila lebanonensis]|uniref:Serine-threonine kinase receptor-associated protein n=1 Tax=Drosophila lebanonensis TaxID=7225 RepID=A0A6J2UHK2_DROLE|nr:serine-threonine kinase receptor-associated protein [Scaptodrosophila lebanonensis]